MQLPANPSKLIEPVLADDALLRDIDAAESHIDMLHVWWLGQSGFLLAWNGRRILLDPYLSDSLTKKYADTDKPHIRMTRRVVDPARLTGINVCLVTHVHTDHLDAETLAPLIRSNPHMVLVGPAAIKSQILERTPINPAQLLLVDADQQAALGPVRLIAIPAAHEAFDRDVQGRYPYLSYVLQFASFSVFHAGDTIEYEGQVARLRPMNLDLALLPINGRFPERRVSGNLWGDEAAELARDVEAKLAVPCHYDMFTFNTEPPTLFVNQCKELGQPYRVLGCGERLTIGR